MATPDPVELCTGGPRLSPVVAGCWRMADWGWDAPQRLRWIEQVADLGVTSFDHADIYGGGAVEVLFGEALALAPGLRERLQLVGKVGIRLAGPGPGGPVRVKHYDTGRAHVLASVERSLRALRTDRLDLLLVHRPDPLMDAAGLAATLADLVRSGRVRHVGASNFGPADFELLDAACAREGLRLATNQVELHPLQRGPLEDGTLAQAQRLGRRPMVWSPLAGGRLLGGDESEDARRVRWVLGSAGARLGVSPATLACAWLLRLPAAPLPVLGTRRPEALREALAALKLRLDPETWAEVWQAGAGRELP